MSVRCSLPVRNTRSKRPRYTEPEIIDDPTSDSEEEDTIDYEIEAIIGWRRSDGLYLVKWKGYPHTRNCWMHSDQLPNAIKLITAFHLEAAYPSNPMVQALLRNVSTLNSVIADTTAQAAAEAA